MSILPSSVPIVASVCGLFVCAAACTQNYGQFTFGPGAGGLGGAAVGGGANGGVGNDGGLGAAAGMGGGGRGGGGMAGGGGGGSGGGGTGGGGSGGMGGMPVILGDVPCDGMACEVGPSNYCCVAVTGQPGESCQSGGDMCGGNEAKIHCNASADCDGGDVCCGTNSGGKPSQAVCAGTCSGPNEFLLCDIANPVECPATCVQSQDLPAGYGVCPP